MDVHRLITTISNNIENILVGKRKSIQLALIAVLSRGHILIEDVPGIGKTTLVTALAQSLGCSFRRIQFTPDVMPSDVTGFSMLDVKTGEFKFKPGAIMSQIVLADEINRTSPKTQSALLEVMQEGQVTVDGETYKVPSPFLVLATQNPVDYIGTYPLPEAQMDRFLIKITMGYPSVEEEVQVLERHSSDIRAPKLSAVTSAEEVVRMQEFVPKIYCSPAIFEYVSLLAARTRQDPELALGVSPRGSLGLTHASRALALLSGREFVIPDDVKALAEPVLAHRIILHPEAKMKKITPGQAIARILSSVPVPGSR